MAPDYATMMSWSTEQRNAYYDSIFRNHKPMKVETKKERIKRIAIEKMLASWKMHNQKTQTIIEIKQICKPRHSVGVMGIRNHRR